MADLTPEQQQEQYAAIELLYSEGRWSEVLQASEALLAVLPPVQGHPLRPRLELVIGHTLLYGLADLNGAEARYRAVLVDTEEPVLREIAEQGLSRCDEQRQEQASAAEVDQALAAASEQQPLNEVGALEPELGESPLEAEASIAATMEAAAAMVGAEASAGAPGMAAMPWDLNSGGSAGTGSPGVAATGAAMPWLTELGIEPEAAAAEPLGAETLSSSAEALGNPETLDFQQLAAQAMAEEVPASDQPITEETQPSDVAEIPAAEAFTAPEAEAEPTTASTAAEETLTLLREPDDLIPVTVQVLEEPQPTAEAPEPPKEEPPLSPEEMTELARGLLEVVLR